MARPKSKVPSQHVSFRIPGPLWAGICTHTPQGTVSSRVVALLDLAVQMRALRLDRRIEAITVTLDANAPICEGKE